MVEKHRVVRFLLDGQSSLFLLRVGVLRAHAFHRPRAGVLLELLLGTFHGAWMPWYLLLVVREEAAGAEQIRRPHVVRAPGTVSRR